ncbi:MAG: tetratricopeptide repeat protein [Fidelibacterota bacterium]|nr:MAG: tetratricopeptide repeat protein [Candidatus Neomarinimicrobiota bacterium]
MRAKLIFSLSVVVLLGMIGCAPKAVSQSDLDTPEYHYRLGLRSLNNGDYATALTAFQRSVDLDRKFARGWSGLGLTKAYQKDFEGGEDAVDKGVDLASKDEEVWVFRGRFWTVNRNERNWLDKATSDFERALRLAPGHEGAEYYLGEAYFYGFRFQAAEAQFAKVVALKGELADKADQMWLLAQKIVRARPGTDAGRKIAIKPEITRADLAVLFAEELKLKEVFERMAPATGQPTFQPPSAMAAGAQPTVPPDVAGYWAEPWIMEVLNLGVFEVDPAGNFAPAQTVMRVDYAMAVQRILVTVTRDASLETRYFGESPSRFADVPSSHFAYNAMALCADRGIMNADLMTSRFDPAGKVTGADALLMVREIQSSLRITF